MRIKSHKTLYTYRLIVSGVKAYKAFRR